MFIANFLLGLLLIVLGIIALKLNFQLVGLFGRNFAFESKMGQGTTYLLFQVLSVLLIIVGIATMFSFHDNILRFLLAPLIKIFNPE